MTARLKRHRLIAFMYVNSKALNRKYALIEIGEPCRDSSAMFVIKKNPNSRKKRDHGEGKCAISKDLLML